MRYHKDNLSRYPKETTRKAVVFASYSAHLLSLMRLFSSCCLNCCNSSVGGCEALPPSRKEAFSCFIWNSVFSCTARTVRRDIELRDIGYLTQTANSSRMYVAFRALRAVVSNCYIFNILKLQSLFKGQNKNFGDYCFFSEVLHAFSTSLYRLLDHEWT